MLKIMEQRMRHQDTQVSLKTLYHVRLIGVGVWGPVRLVEERLTGTRYALKRVRMRGGKVPEEVQRESGILAEIAHPFILRMVRTFETRGSVYHLMELVTGGQLHSHVARVGALAHEQVQFYVASAVLVLEHLHERGVVYRDLSPENLLLDAQGYIKLIDFNCAKKLDAHTMQTFTLVGTPVYMSPEVIRGRGYGMEADIWSLGVVFYELACGRLPFGDAAREPSEVLACVLEQPLAFPQGFGDEAAKNLIGGLLTRERSLRAGAGLSGWEEVKSHIFFLDASALFSRIAAREVKPPIVPSGELYPDEAWLAKNASLSDSEELGGSGTRDSKRHKLVQVFKRFDVNGDGRIGRDELGTILHSLGKAVFTPEEVDKMLDIVDTNKDGYIDYAEFSQWIFSNSADAFRNAVGLNVYS